MASDVHLQPILKGLDLLDNPAPSEAQQILARHLVEAGRAEGRPLSDREALIAAQLVMRSEDPQLTALTPHAGLLTDEQMQSFFRLPVLALNAEEKADQRRSWLNPRRWGKHLLFSGLNFGLAVGAYDVFYRFAHWNVRTKTFWADGPHPGLAPIGMLMIVGLCMLGLKGFVSGVVHLVMALTENESTLYTERQKASYRAALDQLTLTQLTQVHDVILREAGHTHNQLHNDDDLVALVKRARREAKHDPASLSNGNDLAQVVTEALRARSS